jgi:YVTN family beta-propeller protein
MKKYFLLIALLFTGVTYGGPILTIAPSATQATVRSDSQTTVTYTVTNNANAAVNQISINPTSGTTGQAGGISLTANNCAGATLASGGQCTFGVVIQGANQPSTFIVRPSVCFFNSRLCSQSTQENILTITVVAINHALRAYMGMRSGAYINQILPVEVSNNSVGTPGPGFSFGILIPSGVALSADGETLYVANQGDQSLKVVDVSGAVPTITASISVGTTPAGIAITPDGNTAYVANEGSNNVSVVNLQTNVVTTTISGGFTLPVGVAVSPDGNKVYVTNLLGNTVTVINTANNTITGSINVGAVPLGVAFNPSGTKAYVANNTDDTVSVIDTSTDTVTSTITNGGTGFIVFSPDGSRAYVTSELDGSLVVINAATNAIQSIVSDIGAAPLGISITPDGSKIYVTNNSGTTLTILDVDNNFSETNVDVSGSQTTFGNFVG